MRLAVVCTIFLLAGVCARSAELFYLDRDAFNNEYVGPVGPLGTWDVKAFRATLDVDASVPTLHPEMIGDDDDRNEG